jgi:hypothetical protein
MLLLLFLLLVAVYKAFPHEKYSICMAIYHLSLEDSTSVQQESTTEHLPKLDKFFSYHCHLNQQMETYDVIFHQKFKLNQH